MCEQLVRNRFDEAHANLEFPKRVIARSDSNHLGTDGLAVALAVQMQRKQERFVELSQTARCEQRAASAHVVDERRVVQVPTPVDAGRN